MVVLTLVIPLSRDLEPKLRLGSAIIPPPKGNHHPYFAGLSPWEAISPRVLT